MSLVLPSSLHNSSVRGSGQAPTSHHRRTPSDRFVARTAPAHWEGWAHLAQACDHASLSVRQAEAARLAAGRATYRAIALSLALSYLSARQTVRHAAEKLRRAHPHLALRQERFARDLHWCMRNRKPGGSAPVLLYAPLPGGGYDSRPVSLRPRPDGERPEDLTACPLRFIRELATQLR